MKLRSKKMVSWLGGALVLGGLLAASPEVQAYLVIWSGGKMFCTNDGSCLDETHWNKPGWGSVGVTSCHTYPGTWGGGTNCSAGGIQIDLTDGRYTMDEIEGAFAEFNTAIWCQDNEPELFYVCGSTAVMEEMASRTPPSDGGGEPAPAPAPGER